MTTTRAGVRKRFRSRFDGSSLSSMVVDPRDAVAAEPTPWWCGDSSAEAGEEAQPPGSLRKR